MNTLYHISISISFGIIIGFLCGGIKMIAKKEYSDKQRRIAKKLIDRTAFVLKYTTFLLLALGLVWCVFFLILGIVRPEQADYANNMAELIVAVLTIISIIFAFVEFLRQTGDKNQ